MLVLSKEYMIDVRRKKKTGETFEETVKPLEVIWAKFPEIYTPKNTVHIDDVNNNFQLNPNNVRPDLRLLTKLQNCSD
jgi:ubiquitin-like domain-containing CTD phosphatase 1